MKVAYLMALVLSAAPSLLSQGLTQEQIRQKLLAQPPQLIVYRLQKLKPRWTPAVKVDFIRADLDGSESSSYFIAYYTLEDDTGGFLRVFKRDGNNLIVAGDQDTKQEIGDYMPSLVLIDVNNDGIPEVKVTSVSESNQEDYFSLFMWMGSSLHDMLGGRVLSGDFVDIDNDGILEIVDMRSDGKGFDIYKLSGNAYRFSKTVADDPNSRGLAQIFKSLLPQIKEKTKVPVFLPSDLPQPIGKAQYSVAGDLQADKYEISLYYELGIGDAGFAAFFTGQADAKYRPEELPNIKEVKLARGTKGFFRPVSCGGSCAPANLWWMDGRGLYQIQLKLSPTMSERDQENEIIAVANSAITAGPR